MKKEELINFIIWLKEQDSMIKNALDPSGTADMYLESVNNITSHSCMYCEKKLKDGEAVILCMECTQNQSHT
jgi:hypothetical protein